MKTWINIQEQTPPKGIAIIAECDDNIIRTLWRCNCKDEYCQIYRDSPEGSQLSIEIIKWKVK